MSLSTLITLIIIFFVTSVIGVVTGSNSLITVPVMFQLGIDEKTAIATNMFGLTFMAVGGAIPFLRKGTVNVRSLSPMIVLTVIGSAIGAAIVGVITNEAIKMIVTIAMFAIVIFTLVTGNGRRDMSEEEEENHPDRETRPPLLRKEGSFLSPIGYILVFLLAIYGGLYSGGYVTVLTAALVAFFGMTYKRSIASTKVINIFSSGVATLVFIYQGLVNFYLGILIGITMFVGAYIGAHIALKLHERVLRLIFYSAVLLLAVKMLFDLLNGS